VTPQEADHPNRPQDWIDEDEIHLTRNVLRPVHETLSLNGFQDENYNYESKQPSLPRQNARSTALD